MKWYLEFDSDTSQIPQGANKLPFVRVPTSAGVWTSGQAESIESLTDEQIAALGFATRPQVRNMAASAPGSHWYIFGEANRYGHMTGARFAPVFRYYMTQLRIGDPNAKIIGTSILNWDFTCLGCGAIFSCGRDELGDDMFLSGYPCGKMWLDEFIDRYEFLFGEKPPVDAWAIDVYPVDWSNTPNNDPERHAFYRAKRDVFMHWDIAVQQVEGMRGFLSTIPEYINTPIWITEIALHVGYEGFTFLPGGGVEPVEPYHWDKMSGYVSAVSDWLVENSVAQNIERWFFFTTWKDIVNVPPLDPYMGIIFFDGPLQGASINCLGEVYRARSLNNPNLACDASGNTVAASP